MKVLLLYYNVCIVFVGLNVIGIDVYLKDISKL